MCWIIDWNFDEWKIKCKLGFGPLPKDGAAALAVGLLAGDASPEDR